MEIPRKCIFLPLIFLPQMNLWGLFCFIQKIISFKTSRLPPLYDLIPDVSIYHTNIYVNNQIKFVRIIKTAIRIAYSFVELAASCKSLMNVFN